MATRRPTRRAAGRVREEEYRAYLLSPEWKARREEALERAGHRCQICYSAGDLEVHHRTYQRFGHEAPGDLTVLCTACHALYHGRVARRRNSRRSWRREKWLWWAFTELDGAFSELSNFLSFEAEHTGRGGDILRNAVAWRKRTRERVWKELTK